MNNGGAPIRLKHRVAVYGTLKRGRNNSHILRGERFVGTDWMPKLSLYHLGPYPGAVEEPSTGVRVEIYEVKDSTLKILDELEDFFPDARRAVCISVEPWTPATGRPGCIFTTGRSKQSNG